MSKLKYGMATVGAIGALVGVAGLTLPQALADHPMSTGEASDAMDQQSWIAQRAKHEYGLLKQECETLHYSQPQAYEPCLEKAKSTRENLLTQAQSSEQGGQGSPSASSQPGQEQGPIDKVATVVKEKLADWGIGSSDQGQPGAGQQGQGAGQASGPGRNPLQAGFDPGQSTQGQGVAQQSFGGGTGQGGQNVGQQGQQFQGQQFQGQQGQSAQGSFQGGNFGQQPQGQQGTGGANQQFPSGGTQGQGSSSPQVGSTSGSAGGEEEEHMDSVAYYQELARRQFATLKQECAALKQDPAVYEQCQQHAKSVKSKIAGMAEQSAQ